MDRVLLLLEEEVDDDMEANKAEFNGNGAVAVSDNG